MTISTNYIKFSFVCGNGVVVVCPSANCSESCRILKGQQQLDMYSGVLAIRGVSFIDGYQSPYEAN